MANLPTGYTELEYIESTGTQYIKTGIYPKSDTRIQINCKFSVSSTASWLFGARAGTYVSTFNFLTVNNLYRSDYGNGVAGSTFSVTSELLSIDKNGNTLYVNGELKDEGSSQSFTSSYELYLFANNDKGALQGPCKARLMVAMIYDGESLIRHYIPCKNPSNEVGLYDTVSESFFRNSGTGSFVAGPELAPPETPSNFFQSASVILQWSPVVCDGYRIYRNGVLISDTKGTIYIDYDVSGNQDIEYSVSAYRGSLEGEPKTITVQVREGYTILIPIVKTAFFQ